MFLANQRLQNVKTVPELVDALQDIFGNIYADLTHLGSVTISRGDQRTADSPGLNLHLEEGAKARFSGDLYGGAKWAVSIEDWYSELNPRTNAPEYWVMARRSDKTGAKPYGGHFLTKLQVTGDAEPNLKIGDVFQIQFDEKGVPGTTPSTGLAGAPTGYVDVAVVTGVAYNSTTHKFDITTRTLRVLAANVPVTASIALTSKTVVTGVTYNSTTHAFDIAKDTVYVLETAAADDSSISMTSETVVSSITYSSKALSWVTRTHYVPEAAAASSGTLFTAVDQDVVTGISVSGTALQKTHGTATIIAMGSTSTDTWHTGTTCA